MTDIKYKMLTKEEFEELQVSLALDDRRCEYKKTWNGENGWYGDLECGKRGYTLVVLGTTEYRKEYVFCEECLEKWKDFLSKISSSSENK